MPTLLTMVTMFSVRISGDIILKPIRIMSKDPKDPSPQTSGQVVLPHIVVSSLAGGDYLCQQRPLCLDFVEFTWIWKWLSWLPCNSNGFVANCKLCGITFVWPMFVFWGVDLSANLSCDLSDVIKVSWNKNQLAGRNWQTSVLSRHLRWSWLEACTCSSFWCPPLWQRACTLRPLTDL